MKLTSYLYLIFIVALYVINYFFLKINVFPFTGIVLAVLIILIIAINVYVKFKNKKKGLHSDDFIFSPDVAKNLKKIDMGIQYETSIIATFFLIVGLLLFVIYTIFFTPYSVIIKVFIAFNSLFAMVLMGSMLITNYQQFIAYRESTRMFSQFTDKVGTEVLSDRTMFDIVKTEDITEEQANKITEGEVIDFTKAVNDKEMIDKLFSDINNKNQDERGF